MSAMTVGKLRVITRTSLNTRESTQWRFLMIAVSVGNLLVGVHYLLNMTGFILERDPMNVVNVGRPSATILTFSIRKLLVEKKLLNAKNMEKPSSTGHNFPTIWESTQERS